ncbi:receptor expression-enhancing protein 1-like [Cochliomyia hominivorax]
MISILFSRLCILTCGTLYPGYISFKTVRAKIAEDYVKWMMYWIVFAIFTATETFTDIFLSWFPCYYEFKVALILWLLPSMGNGSTFIYKNCIHPLLKKHETRVDQHLEQVREKGQDMIIYYMKEAASYIGRGIMNVINKNFPNGILGLLASNNPYGPVSTLQRPGNLIIEELQDEGSVEEINIKTKKTSRRASSRTSSADNNNDHEEPSVSRGRPRKARQSKPDIDYNLNEN